ncbi:MAG: proline dehydrogenase family protein [Ardenticatenaceae bacterium]|nr:proline dehydrogenase family protein [Anaerolineales bacterium]MCB8920074.1 proline dehydrogenase family protein [Ardenticatenaceae bacterium]
MSKKRIPLFLLFVTAVAWTLTQYGARWLRLLLIYLSHANWARQLISSLPITQQVAGRFVAGETMDDAIDAAHALTVKGMHVTMDLLGEHVSTADEAIAARGEIARLLERIAASGLPDTNVSVKLSQLGLHISEELVLENMRILLTLAQELNNKIRIDMEESEVTDVTLRVYHTLRQEFPNVGIVIQAYLRRSEADIQQLIEEGAWVRLCKGAYAEPPEVAFPDKEDTDTNFVRLTEMMLSEHAREKGVYLGIATHDDDMIEAALAYAQSQAIDPRAFEFQMLHGIRRDLQESLVARGYQVRVYVPYGTAWYPYFVRRLAERPANLWFFVSNLLRK